VNTLDEIATRVIMAINEAMDRTGVPPIALAALAIVVLLLLLLFFSRRKRRQPK
jgi:LPXTG-motif cell wall-anchored protein